MRLESMSCFRQNATASHLERELAGACPAVIEPLPARMVEATPSDRPERLDEPPEFVVSQRCCHRRTSFLKG
jgi:hypothetical protein